MRRLPTEAWVLVVLAVVLAATILFAASIEDGERARGGLGSLMPSRSSYDAQPGGCKALFLTLQESGYDASRWRRPWTDLPARPAVLVSLSGEVDPSEEEWDAVASWVRDGGLLILAPQQGGRFIAQTQHSWGAAEALFDGGMLSGVQRLGVYGELRTMRELSPPRRIHLWDDALPLASRDGRACASFAAFGKGGVLLLDAPEIASNDGIARDGNLRFLLNSIGGRPVLFDEYHHGHAESKGLWAVLPVPLRFGVAAVALGGIVLLWALSRRMGAAVAERPVAHERSEYVDSMAALLRKAGANALVARLWRKRLRERLARELGCAPSDDLAALSAARGEAVARRCREVLGRLDRAAASGASENELMQIAHEESELWKGLG